MRFYSVTKQVERTGPRKPSETLPETKERGQKPKDLVNVIINQFEEIIYGQKLPEDRILKAETETRAKLSRNDCKINTSHEAAIPPG